MSVWGQPPGGFTKEQRRQRRRRWMQAQLALVAVATTSLAGVAGYRWITAVDPVDRSHAIDLFRAERQDLVPPRRARKARDVPTQEESRYEESKAEASKSRRKTRQRGYSRPVVRSAAEQPNRSVGSTPAPTKRRPSQRIAAPQEGVYSWATEGYEEVGGARREFPGETQRIISGTRDGTWSQHHYFSEQRQIWTAFRPSSAGVEVTQQRNKVTFGPVTRESQIDFSPPMLAAPRSFRVGFEWHGEWTGETYGNYSSKVFDHTTMAIGGERVEVWGMTYVINLRGDQEGRVTAQVWFAPRPGLTVKEHYVQDVESSGARYHAEWMQTLKSLQPRQ